MTRDRDHKKGPPATATNRLAPGLSGERRRAFDVATIGLGVISLEGVWLGANAALSKLTGRDESELVGATLEDVTHPDDVASDCEALRRLLDGEAAMIEREKRLVQPSGHEVWIRQRIEATRDNLGRPIHFIWQGQDVSEQRKVKKAWNDAEERLRLVVAHAPIVLCAMDRKGILTLAEGRGLIALGLGKGEAVGRSAFEVLGELLVREPDGRLTKGNDILKRALAGEACGGRVEVGDKAYAAKVVPVGGESGEVLGVVGVATDVTERIRAEAAFRESESSFRWLIERTPEMILAHRGDKIIYVNAAASSALGYAEEGELLGESLDAIAPGDEPKAAMRAVSEGSERPRAVELRRRDGRPLLAEVVGVSVTFSGAPAIVSIARDVTEREQQKAHLLQTDRLVALGGLAAGVAHEINNPLTYVLGNLDLVSRSLRARADEYRGAGVVSGEEVARVLDGLAHAIAVSRDGSERVRRIVRDLTTFARIESDDRALLDVRAVLSPVINLVQNELRHRARFEKDFRDVPLVDANEGRLGQVFMNLLLNAIHAIPEGDAEHHEIRVRTFTDEAGRAIVEFEDTGRGMPEEIVHRIFEPFFTTKPVGGGTGLGLSICHGTVTALGGEISVRSALGAGSSFKVAIPPAIRPVASLRNPPRSLRPIRARVLVIDDEPLVGGMLRRGLSQHEVQVVTSAREGVEMFQRGERFDVILCDLMMPDMSGMELGELVESTFPELGSAMVYMTGGAFTDRAQAFRDRGGRWLDKPLDLDELRRVVDEVAHDRRKSA